MRNANPPLRPRSEGPDQRRARHRNSRPPRLTAWTTPVLLIGIIATTLAATMRVQSSTETPPRASTTIGVSTAAPSLVATTGAPRLAEPPNAARSAAPETVPGRSTGAFRVAPGSSPQTGTGRLVSYTVEVEEGISIRSADFATSVDQTLADIRGWTSKQHAFQRVDGGKLRILLATPRTTDKLCAPLRTRGEVSCRNGNLVVINGRRWVDGAPSYQGDRGSYRQYVVNHEVGHSLGLAHEPCPAPGAKAPVMLQQTLGLQGCEANPWP